MRSDSNLKRELGKEKGGDYEGLPGIIDTEARNEAGERILRSHSMSGSEPNSFFYNAGARRFYDWSAVSGLDHLANGRSFAYFDYDRDGWIDIALVNSNNPQLVLYRNQLGERHEGRLKGLDGSGFGAAIAEFERIAEIGIERFICGAAFFKIDLPVAILRQAVAVETGGVIAQRIVAALAHFVDHVRDIAPDLRIAFAPVAHDARKGVLEAFSRSFQPLHQAASRFAASARKPSTSAATRGSVFSAARLTIRRAEMSRMRLVSTSPFSRSVVPVETRSTMRPARPSAGAIKERKRRGVRNVIMSQRPP